jgi:hypothetical protein
MTDAELIAELASPAYAGMTAAQKVDALNAPKQGVNFPFVCASGTTTLYFIFEALTAFTPANAGKFTLQLAIDQN